MKQFTKNPALVVVTLLLLAGDVALAGPDPNPVAAPDGPAATAAPATSPMPPLSYKGCYNSSGGMQDAGGYIFQSSGYCQRVCVPMQKGVFGVHYSSHCFCGDELPPDENKVDESQCNLGCSGTSADKCMHFPLPSWSGLS